MLGRLLGRTDWFSQSKACKLLTAVFESRPEKEQAEAHGATANGASSSQPIPAANEEVQSSLSQFIEFLCKQLRYSLLIPCRHSMPCWPPACRSCRVKTPVTGAQRSRCTICQDDAHWCAAFPVNPDILGASQAQSCGMDFGTRLSRCAWRMAGAFHSGALVNSGWNNIQLLSVASRQAGCC